MPVDPKVFDLPAGELLTQPRAWLLEQKSALTDEINTHYATAKRISDAADGREFTHSQRSDYKRALDQAERLNPVRDRVDGAYDGQSVDFGKIMRTGGASDEGTPKPYLTRSDTMVDHVRRRGQLVGDTSGDLDLDKVFRGIILGDWRGADAERRAMSEGTGSAGGYLVPTVTSAQVIDLARNMAQTQRAGVTTVPLTTQTTTYPRQITDPALTWHTENGGISASTITFDKVTFVAQALPCLVQFSRELMEDSAGDLGGLVARAIAKAIALELDRVTLRGSGTAPEPRGILNQTGINTSSLGTNGAAPTWDNISTANQVVEALNFDPNAAIVHSRTAMKLAQLKDSQGRYLNPPVDIADVEMLSTSQIPTNLTVGTGVTCSEVYLGQWDQALFGLRTELQLEVLKERYADNAQIGVFAWLRGDVQLAHPTAFNVLTGVL